MKLVYLIAGTFNSGGMERVLTGKANWFAAHGHEVVVVTTDQRGQKPYFQLDGRIKTFDLGINYDETNGSLLRKMLSFPVKQWRHQRRLTALLKQLKADVVICMFNNDVSFVHKIQDGSRKILEIHFSKNKKLQYGRRGLWALADRWRTQQEEKLVRKYDRFIVLTHEDAALWGNLPNISVIPNARTFQPERQADLSQKRVLSIGRYDYQKGFDRLIDIWGRVKGMTNDDWHLDIVGDGPLHQALQQQVERQGLSGSVHLIPPTSDIQSLYLRSSIFVLTSRYEGLPMVLLEAQACGLPIVAFACQCGPRDIIEDGVNGYLIENQNEAQFTQRLITLMGDSSLRKEMGKAALQSSERFSEESVMQMWQEVIRRPTPHLLVVSAVNLRKGGTLTILQDCLQAFSAMALRGELRVVALVHRRSLCDYPGIEYIELPWSVRSWAHRLWCEYVTMHGISKQIGDIDLWLSLHDTTPRVQARHQAVYCHNSYPFFRWHWRYLWQNYRIVCFALCTRWFYRINLRRNDFVIVQQSWFREAFAKMFGIDMSRIVVFPPKNESGPSPDPSAPSHVPFTFLYPAYPDVHKNFECVCEAAEALEQEVGPGRFEVLMTTSPDTNRYSRWLHRKWGHVASIRFCGFVPKEELLALYAQADCLVFPSHVETWGLPISEFAVSDRPMLLADLPYAHETAAGSRHTAFFAPDSPHQLKHLMSHLLNNDTTGLHPVPPRTLQPPVAHSWREVVNMAIAQPRIDVITK